jgi:uncharacterized protein YbjT (DUF2867 family)
MPQRTFTEARRIVSRADDNPQMQQEFDQAEEQARERVRRYSAPQRQKLDKELADLTQAAERNRDALRQAVDDLVRKRLVQSDFNRKRDKLAQDQRVVVARAERVRARVAQLDRMEEDAPDTLDRIARSTGMGKTDFSF